MSISQATSKCKPLVHHRFGVQPGIYILEAHDNMNYFDPVLVNVGEKNKQGSHSVNITAYNLRPSGSRKSLRYPINIQPKFPIEYFDAEQPFSIMNLAKNPMFMMIGMSVLMYFCMQNMPKPGNIPPLKE